ncbi:MAG: C4-dicarboxylate transporter DctM subunit [Paracoccaceae bacterium]|jgi:C4-dicarboxylate transporter DctM subunit
MEVAILFAMIIGLLLIGVPIGVSLGLSSTVFLLVYSNSSLGSIAQTLFQAMAGHYTLLAIPFFILASSFMSTGGVAERIIRFAIALVGHMPGGLAIAGVFACMLFAALSGSSPATVVAIGSIVIAGMQKVGYTKDFAAGVICNAGTLGILIPPSIVMVVYAAATDVSVGRMFLAGVIPGILAGCMLMLGIYITAKVRNLPKGDWLGWGEVFTAALDASWGLFLIIIILGGIYGGIFTPTEAAAVAALYAFLVAFFIYRDMGPLKSRPWLRDTEKAPALLGARIWGFAIVALILYAALAGMIGFTVWVAILGAAAFTAVIWVAARMFVAQPKAAGTITLALMIGLSGAPIALIFAMGGALSGGSVIALALFLALAAALLAFALRTGAEALATTSATFDQSVTMGGRAIARGIAELFVLFIPSFVSRANRDALFEGGKLTVTLLFIIANALILKHVLTDEQIPQSIAASMLDVGFGPIVFLIIVNVILLIGGQFMEPSGLIIIVAPLVFPIAMSLGIDPIHLGIIMVVNMEIGMITPPVGLNLFVTSGVAGMPMMRVVRAALPWLGILFIFLIMVTYIPWLSTFLPTTFMGPEIIIR